MPPNEKWGADSDFNRMLTALAAEYSESNAQYINLSYTRTAGLNLVWDAIRRFVRDAFMGAADGLDEVQADYLRTALNRFDVEAGRIDEEVSIKIEAHFNQSDLGRDMRSLLATELAVAGIYVSGVDCEVGSHVNLRSLVIVIAGDQ